MSEDSNDDENAMEQRLREKWGKEEKRPRNEAPIEFCFYAHELSNERGGTDPYWRFDRVQGLASHIHREFNSKMLAMLELDRLRTAGFTVHVIQTPGQLTLEAQAAERAQIDHIYQTSKNAIDIIEKLSAWRRGKSES